MLGLSRLLLGCWWLDIGASSKRAYLEAASLGVGTSCWGARPASLSRYAGLLYYILVE